jgi:acyl-CoA reductase-like NAD-dependent aldehyde dehydrogenase
VESLASLINGENAEHDKWIYSLRASAMLRDEIGTLRLKRALDRGMLDGCNDDRVAGRVGISTSEQISQATEAAKNAQLSWRTTPVDDRIELGRRIHDSMVKHYAAFVDFLVAEGHPRRFAELEIMTALEGTSERSLEQARAHLEQKSNTGDRETRLVRKPDGVVCIHPPHNAPAANSLLGIGAILVGNGLVVKAPRSVPLTTAWVWREVVHPAIVEFGAPPGLVNLICAEPAAVLQNWLESDDVHNLMYFGESNRGMDIGRQWFIRNKKTVLELAGNDGVLVWDDAEVDLAVDALTECFFGSGQVCVAPNYAIVHPAVADEVIARLADAVAAIRPGMPEHEATVLSPVFKSAQFFDMLRTSQTQGARLMFGGRRIDINGRPSEIGFFIEPTVIRIDGLKAAAESDPVRQETFFPLLPIVVPDADDTDGDDLLGACIALMNRNAYGLRNTLWTQSEMVAERFCIETQNGGTLKVNDSHIGVVPGLATHGGTGLSGGPYGGANYPILGTSHLQAISIATRVQPRRDVFTYRSSFEGASAR